MYCKCNNYIVTATLCRMHMYANCTKCRSCFLGSCGNNESLIHLDLDLVLSNSVIKVLIEVCNP